MAWEGIRQAGDAIAAAIRRNNERQWIEKERLRVEAERQRLIEEDERDWQRGMETVKTAGAPNVGYKDVGMGGLGPAKMATSVTQKTPMEFRTNLQGRLGGLGKRAGQYAQEAGKDWSEDMQKDLDKLYGLLKSPNISEEDKREAVELARSQGVNIPEYHGMPAETPSDLDVARTKKLKKETGLLGTERSKYIETDVGLRKDTEVRSMIKEEEGKLDKLKKERDDIEEEVDTWLSEEYFDMPDLDQKFMDISNKIKEQRSKIQQYRKQLDDYRRGGSEPDEFDEWLNSLPDEERNNVQEAIKVLMEEDGLSEEEAIQEVMK